MPIQNPGRSAPEAPGLYGHRDGRSQIRVNSQNRFARPSACAPRVAWIAASLSEPGCTRIRIMEIPSGLRALLSQMGLIQQGAGKGPGTKANASAMKGAPGPATGQTFGEDGLLLTGLGYAGADKHTDRKNVAEKSNLSRFLQEAGREGVARQPGSAATEEPATNAFEARDGAPAESADAQEGQETREARSEQQEVRQQERRDDARLQGQKEAAEHAEVRESSEADQAEQQQHPGEEEDEEDKPGAGWVAEENEDDREGKKRGLRDADLLGQPTRCRGHLEDGSRCLRKPTEGTPYCPEHAAQWPAMATPPKHHS